MSDLTAADVIARRLAQAGARRAFGMPGGEVLALIDALDRAGIEPHLTRHETAACFVAEGHWHGGGGLPLVYATIGPGLANAVNGIANAWQDRVPMIVLSGSVPAAERHTYTHQVFDHLALLAPVTKAVFRVEPGTAGIVVEKAVAVATTGRPGPVLMDVPTDLAVEARADWVCPSHRPQAPMAPAGARLEQARGWLAAAERPLVIAGLDTLAPGGAEAVARFCRSHEAPLITTYKAKGVLPEDDPLALGGAGLSPLADRVLLPLVAQADCVVLAGYDPIEMRIGWQDPFPPGQRVIEIGAEANTHFMHHAALNFTGDLALSLKALSEAPARPGRWTDGAPAAAKAELRRIFRTDEDWGPAAVIDAARQACPAETVATVDSGAHRILFSQLWAAPAPRTVLQSSALCTMGGAVPLAIGARLADPQRPVIAFVGDGGLEMFLGELATARDLAPGLPIVVFVDGQLALIEMKQRQQQRRSLAVEFPVSNYPAAAEAMGGHGAVVRDRRALAREITAAFERKTFTLIAAVIGGRAYDGRF